MAENDWEGWKVLTEKLGGKIQLVGDDLMVTNSKLLQNQLIWVANAILIKPNQIGSLTETINAVKLAQNNGYNTVMSQFRRNRRCNHFIAVGLEFVDKSRPVRFPEQIELRNITN